MNDDLDIARRGLGSLVTRTARQWRRAVDTRLHPFGLTEATWLPLLYIGRATGPMRQKDLAARLGVDTSSIVRVLDSLEASGLIQRKDTGPDRRAKTLVLTPMGQHTIRKVESVADQVRDNLLAHLDPTEILTAHKVLGAICAALDADPEIPPE